MIGTSSACDRGTRRHLYRPLYATRQKHRPYRSIVADMTPLIEALACSQFTTPWPGAKPCTSDEIIEQSVMSPAKAQAARGSRVLTGGRFGILGILFSLASACSRNADRLTSFPRRLFRLCVLAAGQLRGRSDLVARSCIRVGDFGVDALVTRRWRLNDSVLLRQWRLHIVVRAGSILALRGCLLLRVSVGGASLIYSKAEQQRCDRRGAHRAGMEL